jgi:hypothetical protein
MEPLRQFFVGNERPSDGTTSPGTNEADREVEVTVIFTSVTATLAAIHRAGVLLNGLNGRISLVSAQSVPYPLSLESPAVSLDFNKQRLIDIASESPIETTVHLYLCRWRLETLALALKPGAVVVIGARKRWWPTWETRIARRLERCGFQVVLLETT